MRDCLLSALFVTAGAFLVPAGVSGHHGSASFDIDTELTLEGTVAQWRWTNPHCFLMFEVTNEDGTVTRWAAETSHPTDMTRRGWTRTSFEPGDEVTVVIQPVRSGAPLGRIRSVTLPDGRTLLATGQAPPVG